MAARQREQKNVEQFLTLRTEEAKEEEKKSEQSTVKVEVEVSSPSSSSSPGGKELLVHLS